MASSIVDKYEQILAADPRSRIFVELAKALVDRGEHARAVEVCQRGLEHHPSSVLARITWGRALLEAGDPKGALDQFEIAIALEPSSPYAFNLVGEALLKKAMHREALPVLARAAELQPADARVRGWLEDARRQAKGGAEEAAPTASTPSAPPAPPAPRDAGDDAGDEKTEPYRPIGTMGPSPEPRGAPPVLSRVVRPAAANDGGDAAARPADDAVPGAPANGAARPPPLPSGATPPPRPGAPRSVLYMIPGDTRETIGPAARRARPEASAPAEADPAEAERIARQYEREVRERLAATPEPPPSFLDRHRRLVAGGAMALALAAAGVVYWVVDERNAERLAQTAASRARAGLARDTAGSLREAARLLDEARRRRKGDAELVSLSAQVSAVLASEHGDEDARAKAAALAAEPHAGDGGVAARWLLAGTPAERKAAEADVLAARPSAAPLVQALAGRILVRRGEVEGGRGRLEIAAHATPPLLRALSDLGDLALRAGDPDAALALYGAALAAQPTHPRSAVGAAEARLALGRDLDAARRELAGVDADAASAPPRDVRARFETVYARVLAASGDPDAGAARLQKAAEALGESAELAAALAELHLGARAWEKAEAAAVRAVRLEPREASHRVLLARARIGRGRYAEALSATEGQDGRAIRIQRAIARLRLGQLSAARAELERTAKGGNRMPAEAAVWYGLVDVAAGKAERALPLLERLAAARAPPPLAHVALGRALEADGRPEEAEEAYREAMRREPDAPEGALALGELLVARNRPHDAIPALERAAKLDPGDLAARRALGEARLLAGQPSAARADLDFVLLAAPRDAAALRLLSAAWLAEGVPAEARRAADRAVAIAPGQAAVQVAAARAALAAGDAPAARRHAERALRLGGTGALREDARKVLADARSGKRR